MARIPVTNARRSLDPGSPVSYPSSLPTGAALEGLGNNVASAAQQYQRDKDAIEKDKNRRFEELYAETVRQREKLEDFEAHQALLQLGNSVTQKMPEIVAKAPPSGEGIHDGMVDIIDKEGQALLGRLSPRLQEEYGVRLQTARSSVSLQAAQAERDQRHGYFRNGIARASEEAHAQVFNDPAQTEAARAMLLETIDKTDLPEIEKEALREQAKQGIAISFGEREKRDALTVPVVPADAAARLGVSGAVPIKGQVGDIIIDAAHRNGVDPLALATIARLESGGNPNAKNPRSSAGGLFQFINSTAKIYGLLNKFDPVAASDAGARLLRDNGNGLRKALGREPSIGELYLAHQQGLGGATKLLSNPDAMAVDIVGADAVRLNGGNASMTAQQFANLWIRKAEKVAGQSQSYADPISNEQMDPRYSGLSLDKRLEIYDGIIAASNDGIKTASAQADAAYTAYKDQFELNIMTGGVASEQTILNDPALHDDDKSSLLRTFRSQQKQASETDLAVAAWDAGRDPGWNPLDSADTSTANKVFEAKAERLADQPDEVQQAFRDDFIRRSGVIPNSVAADILRGVYSKDPQQFANSMDEAGRVEDLAPISFDTMRDGASVRDDLTDFRHLLNVRGMSALDAARTVLERRQTDWATKEKAYGQEAGELAKKIDVSDVVQHFDTRWGPGGEPGKGVDAATRAHLLVEYRHAFKTRFIERGDEGVAKALALKDIEATWGISTMSGDAHLMKYPPEKAKAYPAQDGSHEYLRQDALAMVRSFADIPEGDSADDMKVWLAPWVDEPSGRVLTAEDWRSGRSPRYRVFYSREVDGHTVIETVPRTWAIPAEQLKTMRDERRAADMREAEEVRAREMDRLERVENFVPRTLQDIESTFNRVRQPVLDAIGPQPSPAEQRSEIMGRFGFSGGAPDIPKQAGAARARYERRQGR